MKDEKSGQSAELNPDHGDKDPSFGTRLGGFVIADQSPLAHQPAEGAFHDPAAWQDFETRGVIGAFDDLDGQFGAKPLDPAGERLTSVTTIHPQDAEPREPTQDPAQHLLCAVAFRGVGRGHGHAEHQSQGIHQQMALPAFDPLGGVIANAATVTVGLHTLAVQNGRRGPAALAVSFPDQRAQRVIEGGPLVVERPLPENVVDRLPSREVGGEIASRAATLDDIQDGIQDAPPIHRWAATFSSLGQHRLEVSPLGIRKTGLIYGVFHAPTEAPL